MASEHQHDLALNEKLDDSRKTSICPDSASPSPSRIEDGSKTDEPTGLILDEEETLARAHEHPSDTTPIFITFSRNDPSNPRNWPKWKRWYVTCFAASLNVITCLCAGGYSSAQDDVESRFGVSSEVATLGLSLYILGFAIGPMLLAPLSEYFGRSPVYICSWFILVVFQGFGGSAPLTNTDGTVSDLWERNESGNAMMIYGLSSTFGPPFALVVTGYLVLNLGYQWLWWFFLIVTGTTWIIMVFTLPETRHSTILERKAKKVQKTLAREGIASSTLIENIGDAHNMHEKRSLHSLFATTLTRPFRFLMTEPITIAAAAYNGFIYGVVYLFNEAFPLVFGPGAHGHGFNVGQQGLAFLGFTIGTILAACCHPFQERYYVRRVAANDGKGVPEARMWQARFGAFLLPISLFWFAWTSFKFVHWIVPIIASVFFGAGIYIVILSVLNYIVDSYQTYSASALAGVILVRNIVGAGFPLFSKQMYQTLGNEWASTLLAFLSLLFVPIPIWWFYRGEQLRLKSPRAREHFAQDEDSPR